MGKDESVSPCSPVRVRPWIQDPEGGRVSSMTLMKGQNQSQAHAGSWWRERPKTQFLPDQTNSNLFHLYLCVCVCVCVCIYIYTHNTHPYIKFILFLTILGLHCCTGFSLVAVSWGYSLVVVACVAQASHCGGFSCCGTRALGTRASVVAVDGLSSCGAWA